MIINPNLPYVKHTSILTTLLTSVLAAASTGAAAESPNIVFILADDLGMGDIGCFGAPDAKTPHIDALARRGVKFTNFYANGQECTPTRTALLTGRYQQRVGGMECAIGTGNVGRYDDAIALAERRELGLPPEAATLPRALKNAGYSCGIFGKWHLGYEPKFNPLDLGFDEFFGVLGGNCDYFTHEEQSPVHALYDGRNPVERDGYFTHLITGRSLRFIDKHKDSDSPFFLYIPYTTPHFPFQTPGDRDKQVTAENFTEGTRKSYVAMLEDLDAQVGEIVQKISDEGLGEKTVIAFASDHGAMRPGRNLPYRDFKGTVFEGGVRAPLILSVPADELTAKTAAFPAMMFDLTLTFLNLAGVHDLTPFELDGIDLVKTFRGRKPPQRDLFWRGRRGNQTWWAVRDGKTGLKYIRRSDGKKTEEWLFNLGSDPFEKTDILPGNGPSADALRLKIAVWEKEVAPRRR